MRLASKRAPATIDDLVRMRAEVRAVDDRLVHLVPVSDIHLSGRNPRRAMDGIDELAASIAEHGLLQAVTVRRRDDGGYELVAGHRRLEAVKTLGHAEIAASVVDVTAEQAYVLTLVENLQREDLTAREEAAALEVLVRERGWTTRQIGEAIKRSHMYVSRRLRVFEDEALAGPVLDGQLAVSTAEELLRADPEARPQFVERAIAENWGQSRARRAVLERNVPTSGNRSHAVVEAAAHVEALLSQGPVSELTAGARAELRRLYQHLALLVAD